MTWAARLKLLVGLVVVLVIVGACTIVFTQRQNSAQSASATITAQELTVGAVYAGTLVDQKVGAGDTVRRGETLFTVRSPQLLRDLEAGVIHATDLDGVDPATGTYDILATVDGTVADIAAPIGDFVGAGATVATIDRAGSLGVTARFTLTARDYGRIARGTAVDVQLPNDTTISGTVDAIEVETVDGRAASTITVETPALGAADIGGLYRPGTPVVATLALRDDGPFAGAADGFRDFLRRMGL